MFNLPVIDLFASCQLPAAWLSLFNVIFVLILVPLLDRIVYPALDRAGLSPSLKTRIMIGMCVAVAAILAAGVTEHFRLAKYWEGGINHTHYQKIGIDLLLPLESLL